ncbi:hypothetical protein [Gluconobacter japonicus]|nr:hypothetical protein [Gluconobacter japonicus]
MLWLDFSVASFNNLATIGDKANMRSRAALIRRRGKLLRGMSLNIYAAS